MKIAPFNPHLNEPCCEGCSNTPRQKQLVVSVPFAMQQPLNVLCCIPAGAKHLRLEASDALKDMNVYECFIDSYLGCSDKVKLEYMLYEGKLEWLFRDKFWRIQAQIAQLGLPLLHVELLLSSLPHPLFLVCGHTGRIAQVFQNVVDLHHHFFQFVQPLRNFGETEPRFDAIRK